MKKKENENTTGMDQFKKKSRGKKKIKWIILAVVLILIVLGVQACRNATKKAFEVLQNMVSTDTVSTRSLIKSVGATGKIVSVSRKDVTTEFNSVMDVTDVFVEVGDTVHIGDKLVAFDTSDLEEDLEDARSALKRTQSANGLSLSNSRRNIEDTERTRDYTLADAADLVAERKKAYDEAVKQEKELEDEMDKAEDNANDAEDAYNAFKKKLDDTTVSGSDAAAIAAYEALKTQVDAAKLAYEQLDQVYQNSKKILQDYRDSEAVQRALDAYNQAVRSYDNTVASQDSMIASAKSGYTQTQLGNDTTSQQRAIEAYEKQLAGGVLTAPVAGMVTHVNVEKGESYSPAAGAVVTIQDVSAFEIEAEIGQYDISDIVVGQHVLIKTDATGDEELEGTVIKVSPVATQAAASGSGVTYAVRISVDTPNDRLRLDMTASLSIIVTEHENALTVPYNAIQKDEAGNTFVEIPGEDGVNNEKKYVHVVMESNYYTEIQKGDLEEGTTVIVIDSTNDYLQFFEEAGF